MENRNLTLRPRTTLGWGPFGPTGNRIRSGLRHSHRRGWGYLAVTEIRRSDFAVAQVIAGPLDEVEHEGSVGLIKISKPRAECGGLIVRLCRAFGQQFSDANPQGPADLVQGQQRWKRRAPLETGDRLDVYAHPLSKVGLGPLPRLAQGGDVRPKAARYRSS